MELVWCINGEHYFLSADAARAEMGTLGGEYRDRCYNFVSEYDEESSTLQSDGRSIASKLHILS